SDPKTRSRTRSGPARDSRWHWWRRRKPERQPRHKVRPGRQCCGPADHCKKRQMRGAPTPAVQSPCPPRPTCGGDCFPNDMTAGPPPAVNLRGVQLADWWRVLNSAFGPQLVQSSLDLERRAQPNIPLERFAVVADLFDDAHRPILAQAKLFAEIPFGSDKAFDFRIGGFERLIDILG